MKNDNRGLSLMELIAVIAMMAVMVGGFTYSTAFLSGRAARECMEKLSSAIEQNKATAAGKVDSYLEIYCDSESNVYVKEVSRGIDRDGNDVVTESNPEMIGKGVILRYRVTGDGPGYYRNIGVDANHLILGFNRSSGAFKDLRQMSPELEGKYCLEIKMSKANREYKISLSYLTGKITKE
ncbi:MAG: hypothetical protein K6D96_10520 [Acetatifactor sp.]|nr:hypothetical protein [Acetatifactor sp.]